MRMLHALDSSKAEGATEELKLRRKLRPAVGDGSMKIRGSENGSVPAMILAAADKMNESGRRVAFASGRIRFLEVEEDK